MYLSQIAKRICSKLKNVFVSICRTVWWWAARCSIKISKHCLLNLILRPTNWRLIWTKINWNCFWSLATGSQILQLSGLGNLTNQLGSTLGLSDPFLLYMAKNSQYKHMNILFELNLFLQFDNMTKKRSVMCTVDIVEYSTPSYLHNICTIVGWV